MRVEYAEWTSHGRISYCVIGDLSLMYELLTASIIFINR